MNPAYSYSNASSNPLAFALKEITYSLYTHLNDWCGSMNCIITVCWQRDVTQFIELI